MQICSINSSIVPLHASFVHQNSLRLHHFPSLAELSTQNSQLRIHRSIKRYSIQCSVEETKPVSLRTCKQCKTQFDPSLNHPQACRFHTAHFGGETKRKFESILLTLAALLLHILHMMIDTKGKMTILPSTSNLYMLCPSHELYDLVNFALSLRIGDMYFG
ncbi:unnamed protein product [Lactuca saligna]|uniref:Uncharacterized protein n=1 Tax=Lactuca saligna TaxID=75948 RepID=A0AA35YMH6_LACSI|nr:unnamed protein product [Lactuca saligna]